MLDNAIPKAADRDDNLSFVAPRDGKVLPKPKGRQFPRCFWHVKPTGDSYKDQQIGCAMALEYLAHIEATPNNSLAIPLQWIVADVPKKRLGGIEIGFFTMVGIAAGAGAARAREVNAYWERCRNEDASRRRSRRPVKRTVATP
jgi:hypothetical protein